MIHTNFEYKAPRNLKKAIELLSAKNTFAVSGGTKLMNAIRMKKVSPALLVDLKNIRDLKGINLKKPDGLLIIKAYSTLAEIAESPKVKKYFPVLTEAIGSMNDPQYKNRATLGGCIAFNDAASDITAALLALNAVVNISGTHGDSRVQLESLIEKAFETKLHFSEIIVSFEIPLPVGEVKSTYIKFKHPANENAICGVASCIETKEGVASSCRIAITGAAECSARLKKTEAALEGKQLTKENILAAVKEIGNEPLTYISDIAASADYRLHLAKTLTEKAILKAAGIGL